MKIKGWLNGCVTMAFLLSFFALLYLIPSSPANAQSGNGLKGEYYNNMDLTDWKVTRTDPAVNFAWGTGSPDASIGADTFSVRWTGQIRPQYSEKHTFHAEFNGGVRLWVNGELLINKWFDQTAAEWSSSLSLTANTDYEIRLEYYANTGDASMKLYWSSSNLSKQIIPQAVMSETAPLISSGKTAAAEASETGHAPSLAIDADATNASYWGAAPYSKWWQIDLGARYEVRKITIRNYVNGSRYYQYTIQTSTDGSSWTAVASKTNTNPATDAGDSYDVTSLGRYVRVNMTYNSANTGVHISDFKVYGFKECTLTPGLISSGKTAIAEARPSVGPAEPPTYAEIGHGPELAIDSDASNASYASVVPYQHYWQLDLADNYEIKQLNVRNYVSGGRYYQYAIYVSKDQFNWTEVAVKTDTAAATDGGDTYSVNATGRYIRIVGTYNSANLGFHLSDFRAYGFKEAVQAPLPAANRSAFDIIQSEDHDGANGMTFILSPDSTKEFALDGDSDSDAASAVNAGDYLRFDNIDFGSIGADQFIARVHSPNPDDEQLPETVNLEIRLDSPTGTLAGILPAFKQWQRNSTLATDIANVTGVHTVYLVIGHDSQKGLGINWFQFAKKSALPVPQPKPSPLPAPASYNVYFGNLHSHTGFSDGVSVPDYAFRHARDTGNLDFMAVTDHSNLYDHGLAWEESLEWRDIKASANRNTVNGSFVGIAGTETTWYPSKRFGHINTFGLDFFVNPYETKYNTEGVFYDLMKQYPASISQWNHPWDADFNEFAPYDPGLDEVLYLMEVPALDSDTHDYMSYYVKALDLGWHLAPSGNQDNHSASWGSADTRRTAVLAGSLSREHIFDAIRNYRVYSTTDINMKLIYKINGSIMGSSLSNPSTLNFSISAVDPDAGDNISRIEIYTEDKQLVGTSYFSSNNVSWNTFSVSGNTNKYYFLKVIQADGQFAISAPIWTGI